MIDATTVTCPGCATAVAVAPDASAATCARCGRSFAPWEKPTTAGTSVAPLSEAPADADPLVGTTLGGRRLVRVIGRGGMGTVYEALDERLGRVAVKVLPETLAKDASFVSRFHREAKTLASLSHPHVVEVLDRGRDGDRFWFAMEFVRGESLRRPLERGPLPWREATRVASEVLSALSYAHGRGVVHRDLKPENVLLAADGRVRLVDFGLARIVRGEAAVDTARLTRTNVLLGTYEYMAPEQRTGAADVDERADLYAVGVILYETLTGALPIGRFDAPSALRPGCPAPLDAVVHKALASAPKDRFPSAVAFREALDAAVATSEKSAEAAPAAGRPAAAAVAVASPADDDAATRKVLRHVEIIAAGDRVLAVLLALTGAGLFGITIRHLVAFGGSAVLWVGAFLLWKQGAKLRDLRPGSREGQVTGSILAGILFFPIGTVLGVYGLATLTGDDARRVFRERASRGFGRGFGVPSAPPPPPPPPPIDADFERRWPGRAAEIRYGRRPRRRGPWFGMLVTLLVLFAGVLVATGASGRPVGMAVLAPFGLIALLLLAVRMSFFVALLLGLAAIALLFVVGIRVPMGGPVSSVPYADRFLPSSPPLAPAPPRRERIPVPAMGG